MSTMKFDFEFAANLSSDIKSNAGATRDVLKAAASEINRTRSYWVGPSAEAYSAEFARLAPKMEEMVKCVDAISAQLLRIAEIQKQSEEEISKAIGSAN